MRKLIFLLFCMLLVSSYGFSQSIFSGSEKTILKYPGNKERIAITPSMLVSPSFYTCNLAFFCRQEIKLEKITHIPFKFRIGSAEQVDYLEGKKGF